MTFPLLSAADRVAVPWKNGGGITYEVAAWPPGADFDSFDWRVSMAEVRVDGPFSSFPGIDRIMAVLEGRLRLCVEGQPPALLSWRTPHAAFPGDAPTRAKVEAGPVLDLNVMARRGRIRPTLDRLDAPALLAATRADRLIVAVGGAVRVGGLKLGPLDAVHVPPNSGPLPTAPAPGAIAYAITFDRV